MSTISEEIAMWLVLQIFAACCVIVRGADDAILDEIFSILEQGDRDIEFYNKTEFLVLLGLSGSGKSTLAHYLSGNLDTLYGEKTFGELIYTDIEGTIGQPGTISHTLFPEVTIDLEFGEGVVDCPGFEDTRNSSSEIAATYFIKKVFDTSTNVKLVLTISNAGVRPGQDRYMLNSLLTNIIKLVVNIEKYADSLALVVTKVPVNQNDDLEEAGYIREFLELVEEEYKQKLQISASPQEIDDLRRKLMILTPLILNYENRIAVVRAPYQVGPVSQSPYSLKNRNTIREVIFRSTLFVNSNGEDFQFPVSLETEYFIKYTIYDLINKRVVNFLNLITNQIEENESLLGDTSESIQRFMNNLSYTQRYLWNTEANIIPKQKLTQYALNCINYLNEISHMQLDPQDFISLLNQFEFFRLFTDYLDDPYLEWVQKFNPLKEWLQFLNDWYITIFGIYKVVGGPETQFVKNSQFDPDFMKLSYRVSRENAHEFLLKVRNSKLTQDSNILDNLIDNKNNIFINNFIIRDINIVVDMIRPNISCENEVFLVRSNFVSINSDILAHVDTVCPNASVFNIMAYETMFVDSYLYLFDKDLSIISMFMHVTREFIIDVRGSDAPKIEPSKIPASAPDTQKDGQMGHPGSPGGYLTLITDTIDNSRFLTLRANGGEGGEGQSGRNGIPAKDNKIQFYDNMKFRNEKGFFIWCLESNYVCTQKLDQFSYHIKDMWKYEQQRPGNGGVSGYGGLAGDLKMVIFNNDHDLHAESEPGVITHEGIGGQGWETIEHDIVCQKTWDDITTGDIAIKCEALKTFPKHYIYGISNYSTINETKPSKRSNPFQTFYDISEFKIFLMENTFIHEITNFLGLLNNNTEILEFASIRGFLSEFLVIEQRKFNMKNNILSLYGNTMIPVTQNYRTNSEEERQAMVFLTATLSSMIWQVEMKNSIVFVTDLYMYVKVSMKLINDLNTLNIIEATQNIKNNYAESTNVNIIEAQKYITIFINDVFEGLFDDIQLSMSDLVSEIDELRKEIDQQIEKLKEKKEQLRKNLVLHTCFGIINVAATALSMIGPVGTAASIALGAASGITEGLVVGDVDINGMKPVELPKGIANLRKDMEKLRVSRREGHVEAIVFNCEVYETVAQMTQTDLNEAKEIKRNALTIKEITSLKEITGIIDDSVKRLNTLFDGINVGSNKTLGKLVNTSLQILQFTGKAVQISGPIIDAMQKYRNDLDKLELVVDMIKKDEESLGHLNEFEEAIYSVIMPLIETLHSDLSTLETELINQSSVSLVVKRWEVSLYISKLTNTISRYTEGFEVQEVIVNCFNQLNEAANLIVTLFQQIQYYQEHVFFAGYIADLHGVGGGVIPDSSLYKNELVALMKAIISNNIRAKCNSIISSFKQQVFPFAKLHLSSLAIQSNKLCEGEDQTVVNTIKTVETELDTIRNTILANKDQYVNTGTFDSSYVSTPSFAKWNSIDHGNDINQLFLGQEIALMAPIVGKKNAVKFNRAQIRFNRTDGGSQQELDDALKMFTMEQTHFGNSLYKCDDFTFIIRSEPLTLIYALENDKNGNPVIYNNIYTKLLNGDISLSPYTMWRFKLRETYMKSSSFTNLLPFTKNNVNMELYGTGQFVEKDAAVCRSGLQDYYDIAQRMVSNS